MQQVNPFQIQIQGFEGPLDLLLQLVEKETLDIFEISLSKITDEYLLILEEMEQANLEIGGEFLVVASQLTYIKSRLLLPKPPPEEIEEPSAEEMQLAFLQRLATYRMFQEAAKSLAQKDRLGRDVFCRGNAGAQEAPPRELSVALYSMLEAFESVLARARIRVPHQVMVQQLSVADKISEVLDRVKQHAKLSFESLFEELTDRASIIVTFLAILELAKLHILLISQEYQSTPIFLSIREETHEPQTS